MAVTIAKAKLGADKYPYVEPNHLSAPRDGRVYAQLPAANDIKILTNGTFVKYDYAHGEVNFTGEGPWMMVFNEEKLYDERKQSHADFAMKKDEQVRGVMVPRVFGMVPGDIFTTNNLADGSYSVGDKVTPGADGILAAGGTVAAGTLVCAVVKETTMPDGKTPGVKLQVLSA